MHLRDAWTIAFLESHQNPENLFRQTLIDHSTFAFLKLKHDLCFLPPSFSAKWIIKAFGQPQAPNNTLNLVGKRSKVPTNLDTNIKFERKTFISFSTCLAAFSSSWIADIIGCKETPPSNNLYNECVWFCKINKWKICMCRNQDRSWLQNKRKCM